MTKPKTMTIDVPKVPEKWQKVLIYLQNRVPDVFILELPDEEDARRVANNISTLLGKGLPGCSMISTRRGRNVYVVKLQNAQKVIIREE